MFINYANMIHVCPVVLSKINIPQSCCGLLLHYKSQQHNIGGFGLTTRMETPVPALIAKKRDGKELNDEDIKAFVAKVVKKDIHESQIGAMLMAMFLKGLSRSETKMLTEEMMMSGSVLHWPSKWDGLLVDKHSTGGVGDKASLILAPALAAVGLKVPMISGRGLQHTGGTLDKLESIPGYTVQLSSERMLQQLEDVGCFIAGQTEDVCPADKKLYAIRDVTSTVPHVGLITASIISKKAAEKINTLVLDVKMGRGAFMSTVKEAVTIAECMVQCSNDLGVKTAALITDMNSPLGNAVGNSLEVIESIRCLQDKGPQDLTDLVVDLGGHILYTNGNASNAEDGCNQIRDVIANGQALSKFCSMIKAQGVDPQLAEGMCDLNKDPRTLLPLASKTKEFLSTKAGFVERIDAMSIAETSHKLGGGRNQPCEAINWGVGVELLVDIGDKVSDGQPWCLVHYDEDTTLNSVFEKVTEAIEISDTPTKKTSRLIQVVQ